MIISDLTLENIRSYRIGQKLRVGKKMYRLASINPEKRELHLEKLEPCEDCGALINENTICCEDRK